MWARVDDSWWAHPKVLGLALDARGLWISALSWSCAQRTPKIPAAFPQMVGGDEATAKPLEANGLWHAPGHDCASCDDIDSGWIVHDWQQYQAKSLSEKRAEAGRKGGKASGAARRAKRERSNDEANSEATPEANSEAGTRPVPSQTRRHPSAAVATRDSRLLELETALAAACFDGTMPNEGTRSRQQLEIAAADIVKHDDASTQEVARRAREHRRTWPNVTCTPMSIAKHWTQMQTPPVMSDDDAHTARVVDRAMQLARAGLDEDAERELERVGLTMHDVEIGHAS